MKKKDFLPMLLAFVMAFSLVGCGASEKSEVGYQAKAGAAEIAKANGLVKNETSPTESASEEVEKTEETEEIVEDVVEVVSNGDNTHTTKTKFANGDYEELLDMCTFEDGVCTICGGKYVEPVVTSTPEPSKEEPKESSEVAKIPEKETSTPESTTSPVIEKPAEEKPVATPTPAPTPEPKPAPTPAPTPEPTPEPTPTPTPAPETPSTPPSEDEEVDIDSLWFVIDSGMSWNESEHTIIRVLQNAYTCETKDESYSEAHTWVNDEKVLVTNPYGEDYWGIPRHCSVCGYADGHVEPIE